MYWNYVSCCLTVVSTVLVGKRLWHGWILAGLNSVIICLIGFQTRQWGFIPANLFCLVMYVHNIRKWREPAVETVDTALSLAESSVTANVKPQAHVVDRLLSTELPARKKGRRFRKSGRTRLTHFHRFRTTPSSKDTARAHHPFLNIPN
jgi:hypothetical protein